MQKSSENQAMKTIKNIKAFFELYVMYRKNHPRMYAAQRAWSIAFCSYPF